MKMDEYIMHEEYYKSIRGEDGEEPLAVHGSRPRTDLGSYAHSGRDADSQRIQFVFAEFAANSFAARIRCEFGVKFRVLRIRGEFGLRIRRRQAPVAARALF